MESHDITRDHDIVINKSRDMGATWIVVAIMAWFFLFHREATMLTMSAKEEMVDLKWESLPKTQFRH
jgi:hypothetical protein